jgi:hypothetical protein
MQKEIDNIKALIYRSKCSEKLKMNKIHNLKKNIKLYHEENLKGEEIIEKILNNENQITQNEKINNKETNDIEINNLNSEKKLNEEENYDEEKINNEIELNDAIMKGFNNKNKNTNNKKSHCFIEIKIYRYYRDKNIMKYSTLQIAELKIKEGHSMNKENNKSIDVLKMVVKKLNIKNEGNEEEIDIPYRKR